jgi:hypothetical protein
VLAKTLVPRRHLETVCPATTANAQHAIIETALHLACACLPGAFPSEDAEATAHRLGELALADPAIAAELLDASVHLLDRWVENQAHGAREIPEQSSPPVRWEEAA